MTQSIKITSDQMRLMSLFEKVTHVRARDCIEDEKLGRVIFVVENGKMGKAIGKGGSHIKALRNSVQKDIDLVEYHDNPEKFLRGLLKGDLVSDLKVATRDDGKIEATMVVDPWKKAMVVGREGRNIEKVKMLARRYFNISSVTIAAPERPVLEL